MSELENRKEKVMNYLTGYSKYLYAIILGVIIYLGVWIRTRNIPFLTDITTGQYIPADPDAIGFLRYVESFIHNGYLMTHDPMRYFPMGYPNMGEFKFLTYFIGYLYKIVHWFIETVTIQQIDILYPVICFAIGMIFFYLLTSKLFNKTIALIATGFLTVLPSFLFRTMAGVSDKEALAIMLMFMGLYFYVSSLKSEKMSKAIYFSIATGISIAFMGLVWGGVNFVFLTIGVYALIEIILDRFNNKDIIAYLTFVITVMGLLSIGYPARFSIMGFVYSTTTFPMLLAFMAAIIKLFFSKYIKKLNLKLPIGFTALLCGGILSVVFLSIIQGPSYLLERISAIYTQLLHPFASTRWSLTVAESHQPYFANLLAEMGWAYISGFLVGLIVLFHELIKGLFDKKMTPLRITAIFSVLLFGLTMSRYASNSLLNGESNLSQLVYFLSLLGFFGGAIALYLIAYYKKGDLFNNLNKLNNLWIFVIVWYIIMFIGARSALRLIFSFAPVTAVLVGFLIYYLWGVISEQGKEFKIIFAILLIAIVGFNFYGLSQNTIAQANMIAPGYNQQWQIGMSWVRENTPPEAVFAHWWDYGYHVLYGGQRATLTDGGNAIGAINHFMGRHALLGATETEALEFLNAKQATHLLIVSDDIGKYPAFSSIGSDRDYDRYSYIPPFILQPEQTQETRNETIYFYSGTFALDEDFIYGNKVYPAGSSTIVGVFIPIDNNGVIKQPTAVIYYQGNQLYLPLKYLYTENTLIEFEQEGYPGGLMIIPSYLSEQQMNNKGAGLFLSKRVIQTQFTRLYLFNQQSEHFKLVYDDSNQWAPIMYYQGRLVGPMRIWEISYPENITSPEYFYTNTLPDPEVETIIRT